jgi:hypothetical protein
MTPWKNHMRIVTGAASRMLAPVVRYSVDWPTISQSDETTASTRRENREFDIFISYRRDKGSEIARFLSEKLRDNGYRVFLDVDALSRGEWDKELRQRIEQCADFVAVITDGYFDRCTNQGDVVRREIAHALDYKRNIMPFFVGAARIPAELPTDIQGIASHNGVRYVHEYAEQSIHKLGSFLSSLPATGPHRLVTGEALPRFVLFNVMLTIGIWNGAMVGVSRTYLFDMGLVNTLTAALMRGCFLLILIILPAFIILSIVAQKRGHSREYFFVGPWLPFWATSIPIMFVFSSVFAYLPQKLLPGEGFVTGGVLGAVSAIIATRFMIQKNAWSWLMHCFHLKRR